MIDSLKRQWHQLKRGSPGHRFQASHAASRNRKSPIWHRVARFVIAMVALAVGIFFAVMPGPAVVFFALAGALLATESRPLAVAMDWSEVKIRALVHWGRRHWKQLGLPGRIAVITLGAACSVGMVGLSVWMVFLR